MNNKSESTLADVALAANVSVATASRVLHGEENVTTDLRRRVMSAVESLDYRPQRVHKKAASASVAVLTEAIQDAFFANVIAGIAEETESLGYITQVIVTSVRTERKAEVLRKIAREPWAGVIAAGCYQPPQEWLRFSEECRAPLVTMNTLVEAEGIACLKVNFEGAAFQAIQYLLDLGHTRVAYLGDYANEFSAAEFHGVEQALTARGYTYPEEWRFSVPHTAEGASQGVSQILRIAPEQRPTAVMTFDDEFAVFVINALRYYKVRIPEDISVVGFDNLPMSAFTNPALTTVDIPKRRVGRELVRLFTRLLEGGAERPGHTIVDGTLVVRGSTGPAPSRRVS
jgi:DNA-binding LacI/PurR family transcriptional regulator